jgi:hypothetical protein
LLLPPLPLLLLYLITTIVGLNTKHAEAAIDINVVLTSQPRNTPNSFE